MWRRTQPRRRKEEEESSRSAISDECSLFIALFKRHARRLINYPTCRVFFCQPPPGGKHLKSTSGKTCQVFFFIRTQGNALCIDTGSAGSRCVCWLFIFKDTEPSPLQDSSSVRQQGGLPGPPPVVPDPESIDAQAAYRGRHSNIARLSPARIVSRHWGPPRACHRVPCCE